jgi:hypothetical protein
MARALSPEFTMACAWCTHKVRLHEVLGIPELRLACPLCGRPMFPLGGAAAWSNEALATEAHKTTDNAADAHTEGVGGHVPFRA